MASTLSSGGTTSSPPSIVNYRRDRYKHSRDQQRFSFAVPSTKEENAHVRERHVTNENPCPWQCRLLEILNSPTVQHIIIALLILDVCILFVELAIDASFPSCNIIQRDAVSCCDRDGGGDSHATVDVHRFLAGASRLLAGGEGSDGHNGLCAYPLVETNNEAGCDDHKYPGVHAAHVVLFSLTMVILGIFEIELIMMVYLLGPERFFSHVLYALDLCIVTVSLALEITFRVVRDDILQDLVGILVLFRVWRFVRIGHGLVASTFELQEEKIEELKEYVRQMEEMVSQNGGELPKKRPSLMVKESREI